MAYVQAAPLRPPVVGPRVSRVQSQRIARGDLGSRQTLTTMAALVRRAVKDPQVLELASAIVRDAPVRDKWAQAQRIRSWAQQHTQYLNDPPTLELLRTPQYQIDRVARDGVALGDCDDASLLTAALGEAAGIKARFVAVGFQGPTGPLSHVFTQLLTDRGWTEMDVTRRAFGVVPPIHRWALKEI